MSHSTEAVQKCRSRKKNTCKIVTLNEPSKQKYISRMSYHSTRHIQNELPKQQNKVVQNKQLKYIQNGLLEQWNKQVQNKLLKKHPEWAIKTTWHIQNELSKQQNISRLTLFLINSWNQIQISTSLSLLAMQSLFHTFAWMPTISQRESLWALCVQNMFSYALIKRNHFLGNPEMLMATSNILQPATGKTWETYSSLTTMTTIHTLTA